MRVEHYESFGGDPDEAQANIEAVLKDIEIPGYEVVLVRMDLKRGAVFFIRLDKLGVQDNDNPGKSFDRLAFYSFALFGDSVEVVCDTIMKNLYTIEMHEVSEKFSFRGKKIYHPHRFVKE